MILELTALKKEVFDLLRKESIYILYVLLSSLLVFKIAFFDENFVVLARSVLSIFWLFILPGYFAMLFWHEKLDFVQRTLIGTAVAAGLIGTISYYLGLMSLNIKYHTIVLPIFVILSGFSLTLLKRKEKSAQ